MILFSRQDPFSLCWADDLNPISNCTRWKLNLQLCWGSDLLTSGSPKPSRVSRNTYVFSEPFSCRAHSLCNKTAFQEISAVALDFLTHPQYSANILRENQAVLRDLKPPFCWCLTQSPDSLPPAHIQNNLLQKLTPSQDSLLVAPLDALYYFKTDHSCVPASSSHCSWQECRSAVASPFSCEVEVQLLFLWAA